MTKTMMGKNTMEHMTLENGETVNLTLNFARLLKVRSEKKALYERYNKVIMYGTKDVFDNVTIVYTAYMCGMAENLSEAMTEEEFIEQLPPYMETIATKAYDLTHPKKKTDSEKPSGEPENQDE